MYVPVFSQHWETQNTPVFPDRFICGKYHPGLLFCSLCRTGGSRCCLGYFYCPGYFCYFSTYISGNAPEKINCEGTFQWLDLVLLAQIAAIAIPSIMQQSVLSIGNMFVQEIVNRYGSAVIAGYSGAIKLNTFAINSFMALGSCLSSYTAQNLGAGKKERLPLGFRTGIRLSVIASLPFIVLYFFASRQMMGLFLNDSSIDAINAGQKFLHIVSPMYFMISIKLMTDGIIRGAGAMHYFVMATVPDLILRILVALLLTQYFGSTGIWMAWPFGWIAATVLTIIFYRRIITGKYVIRL